jgi:hypothetical protein
MFILFFSFTNLLASENAPSPTNQKGFVYQEKYGIAADNSDDDDDDDNDDAYLSVEEKNSEEGKILISLCTITITDNQEDQKKYDDERKSNYLKLLDLPLEKLSLKLFSTAVCLLNRITSDNIYKHTTMHPFPLMDENEFPQVTIDGLLERSRNKLKTLVQKAISLEDEKFNVLVSVLANDLLNVQTTEKTMFALEQLNYLEQQIDLFSLKKFKSLNECFLLDLALDFKEKYGDREDEEYDRLYGKEKKFTEAQKNQIYSSLINSMKLLESHPLSWEKFKSFVTVLQYIAYDCQDTSLRYEASNQLIEFLNKNSDFSSPAKQLQSIYVMKALAHIALITEIEENPENYGYSEYMYDYYKIRQIQKDKILAKLEEMKNHLFDNGIAMIYAANPVLNPDVVKTWNEFLKQDIQFIPTLNKLLVYITNPKQIPFIDDETRDDLEDHFFNEFFAEKEFL